MSSIEIVARFIAVISLETIHHTCHTTLEPEWKILILEVTMAFRKEVFGESYTEDLTGENLII